ncbi:hypothetical protein F0562_019655 [Nyssa sinensis]|uniref:Uncharacterized protein n=1 Tax=Nyssa sinensis TaxID=561372 RepID=A0A5J5BSA7_9ASTE|nr:hypothetical protein F0562_019655 [Nyssa sinensis]
MVVAEAMKPHVAVLPSPGMGHIIPLFELAKCLVIHHGFRVSFFVITTEASAAQNQLLRSPTLPSDLNVIDLPPVGISDLAFKVCRELSIPTYSFFIASTALFAFSLHLPTLDREVEGEFMDLPEPVQVPSCKAIRTEDLLDQVRNKKIDEYKWYLLHVSRLPMAAGIFANTWDDFEPVSLRALRLNPFFQNIPTPPVHAIGPLIKEDEPVTESDTEILTWLDKRFCEEDGGSGTGGAVVGSTSHGTLPPIDRRVFVALLMELDSGERCPWRADNCVAALLGVENERDDADGRGWSGHEAGGGTRKKNDRAERNRDGCEVGDGRGRREGDEAEGHKAPRKCTESFE